MFCSSFVFLMFIVVARGTSQTCFGGSKNTLLQTTSRSNGTFLNIRNPISCNGYVTKWTFCYTPTAHQPGQMYTLTIAVWSYHEETEMYTISPSSIKHVQLTAGLSFSLVICNEVTVPDYEAIVFAGDVIGATLPPHNHIQVLYSDPLYNLTRIEASLPTMFNASEMEILPHIDMYISADIVTVHGIGSSTTSTNSKVSTITTPSKETEDFRNDTSTAITSDDLTTFRTNDNVTDASSDSNTTPYTPVSTIPYNISQVNDTDEFSNGGSVEHLPNFKPELALLILCVVIVSFATVSVIIATMLGYKYYKRRYRLTRLRSPLYERIIDRVTKESIQTVPNVAYIQTKHKDSSEITEELIYSSMVYNPLYPNYKPEQNDNNHHVYDSLTVPSWTPATS